MYPLPSLMENGKSPLRAWKQVEKYTKLPLHSCLRGEISVKRLDELEGLPSNYHEHYAEENGRSHC